MASPISKYLASPMSKLLLCHNKDKYINDEYYVNFKYSQMIFYTGVCYASCLLIRNFNIFFALN